MTVDHRRDAQARIAELTAMLETAGDAPAAAIVTECQALSRAIAAFHMEGIRFRIYNVDRLLRDRLASLETPAQEPGTMTLPAHAVALLEETRRHLEAAGFHTRSHQAPI
jgi:hypothetical protein